MTIKEHTDAVIQELKEEIQRKADKEIDKGASLVKKNKLFIMLAFAAIGVSTALLIILKWVV